VLILGLILLPSVQAAVLVGDGYRVEPAPIDVRLRVEAFKVIPVTITNTFTMPMALDFSVGDGSTNITDYIRIEQTGLIIDPGQSNVFNVTALAGTLGEVSGNISVRGTASFLIPFHFEFADSANAPLQGVRMSVSPISSAAVIGNEYTYRTEITNLNTGKDINLTLTTSLVAVANTSSKDHIIFTDNQSVSLNATERYFSTFTLPVDMSPGEYIINATLTNGEERANLETLITVRYSFFQYTIYKEVRVWHVLSGLGLVTIIGGVWYYFWRQAQKKRRYKAIVDYSQMPKPGPRVVRLGKFAETPRDMYYEIDQLKTHTLIAGSTGGGKTVSAEVIIEEALNQGSAVICFDPTAQWSGFLRKNTNKKMFGLYPFFGMKPSDAKGFNGNVRQLLDPREYIDITQYMKPGEITVFTITKLDPKDIDIIVANTIKQVFKASLDEVPLLRLVIVFDEVHRLLPKFGGSGAGFTQIERGAREFRKWGVGLILISQVLSDFAGEIKANITTEVQMRTRDSSDLERIKTKYGDYMLQSLVKSATGVGMMQNSAYNRGNPFFVWFRPLLHEHARLSNEELDQYDKYNSILDELEFQLQQLTQEGIDVFDLKLEYKMALDKLKSGNFNMVNIYLEGLVPRVKEHWVKLGKEPKKKERLLVSEAEIQADLDKAKKQREQFEREKNGGKEPPKVEQKVFKPIHLLSGASAVNPLELGDVLVPMPLADLYKEIDDKHNSIADWIDTVDKKWGEAVRKAGRDKEKLLAVLENPPKDEPAPPPKPN